MCLLKPIYLVIQTIFLKLHESYFVKYCEIYKDGLVDLDPYI